MTLTLALVSLVGGIVFAGLGWLMHGRGDTNKRNLCVVLAIVGLLNGGLGLYIQTGLWATGA